MNTAYRIVTSRWPALALVVTLVALVAALTVGAWPVLALAR